MLEGSLCYGEDCGTGCDDPSLVDPIFEYGHGQGCSVTGGYVYRGPQNDLSGDYVYGDYCEGVVRALRSDGGSGFVSEPVLDVSGNIVTFGEGRHGELYVVTDEILIFEGQGVAAAPRLDRSSSAWLAFGLVVFGLGSQARRRCKGKRA